jgi:hypothetical protein
MSEKPYPYVFGAAIRYLVQHKRSLSLKGPQYKALCEAAQKRDVNYIRSHIEQTFVLPFKGKTYSILPELVPQYIRNGNQSPQKAAAKNIDFQTHDRAHRSAP